jgi:putative CocE/NonD family hydrolase
MAGRAAGIFLDRDVLVPMRDGVRLATDVYRPEGSGRHPVVLERTANGKQRSVTSLTLALLLPDLLERGYAVVVQDVRGRFNSAGDWEPFRCEIDDGFDTVRWAATQPWSTGRVGMVGVSYSGATQLLAAMAAPPGLTTIVPAAGGGDPYEHWLYGGGGSLDLCFSVSWSLLLAQNAALRHGLVVPDLDELRAADAEVDRTLMSDPDTARPALRRRAAIVARAFARRPVGDLQALRAAAPYLRQWLHHPARDGYWVDRSAVEHHASMRTPAMHVTGWFDFLLEGTIATFLRMRSGAATRAARRGQRLVIGPWIHGAYTPCPPVPAVQVDFGPSAYLDFPTLELAWLDHWLREEDAGVADEPPIRLFVMGDNAWRDEREWPLARTRWTRWYLHSEGSANGLDGDGRLTTRPPRVEAADRFAYDPRDPVPTLGGCVTPYGLEPGVFDQRPVERRGDVLVFTSAPLEGDLEVTGPVALELWAASSAHDTDFTAKLVDVQPDGRALNVCDGIVQARYRRSLAAESLITPGVVYLYRIELTPTSIVFRRGHRVRVEVSSSTYPHRAPNPNTGEPLDGGGAPIVAHQVVYHDARHPSAIVLPVIPR